MTKKHNATAISRDIFSAHFDFVGLPLLCCHIFPTDDYAHLGPGFPTWHRLLLLWFEREIQIETGDPMFTLHYWDWRDPEQREALFTRNHLGENVNGTVMGSLFGNWPLFCWQDVGPLILNGISPIPICDPTTPVNQTLRRCPVDTACDKDHVNWPTYDDLESALSVKVYDVPPYDQTVLGSDTSFRNRIEGVVAELGTSCGNDTMCFTVANNSVVVRIRLHNSVSVCHEVVWNVTI